jgi:hypothetical protein
LDEYHFIMTNARRISEKVKTLSAAVSDRMSEEHEKVEAEKIGARQPWWSSNRENDGFDNTFLGILLLNMKGMVV